MDSEGFSKLLEKAERWLELCVLLKYKVTHQIEAADAVFSMAMMVGDVDKARKVAEESVMQVIAHELVP